MLDYGNAVKDLPLLIASEVSFIAVLWAALQGVPGPPPASPSYKLASPVLAMASWYINSYSLLTSPHLPNMKPAASPVSND